MLFLINQSNADLYADEIESILRLRHDVLSKEYRWSGISTDGDRETDRYDNASAVYIGTRRRDGKVVGCLRLNPDTGSTLTADIFGSLVEFCELPRGERYYDVSRLVLSPEVRGDPHGHGLDLMCGMYEWGLANRLVGYTAVVSTRVLSWLLQIGMQVDPLGLPRRIEGDMTLAIYLPVIVQSLVNLYARSGTSEPRLLTPSLHLPAVRMPTASLPM